MQSTAEGSARSKQNRILKDLGESVQTYDADFPFGSAYYDERRLRRGFSFRKAGTPQPLRRQLSFALSICMPQAATAAKPFRGAWGMQL